MRRYERPTGLDKRELVRKFCLSLGLLQPGDSRDVIVDIFYVILEAKTNKNGLTSDQIRQKVIELRQNYGLDDKGTAASNIRRQLRRLRELILVEKVKNNYRISEFTSLKEIFENKIERFLIYNIVQRIKEYSQRVDQAFPKKDDGT
ncbi:hypothetical protein GF327_01555 [Candidatus Woesearchaeota archaeon]|nr:hypothetical protein [Candidatus Woesearchaeota archaeon]